MLESWLGCIISRHHISLIIQNRLEGLNKQKYSTPLQFLNSGENCKGSGGHSIVFPHCKNWFNSRS